jgi:hypothetical protein
VSAPFQTPERIEAWGRAVANALLAVINDDIAALVAAAEQRGREQAAAWHDAEAHRLRSVDYETQERHIEAAAAIRALPGASS